MNYDVTFHGAKIPPEDISKGIESIIDKLVDLGYVNPASLIEIANALNYYNRICGNTDFSRLNGGD